MTLGGGKRSVIVDNIIIFVEKTVLKPIVITRRVHAEKAQKVYA